MLKLKLLLGLIKKTLPMTFVLILILFIVYREIERRNGLREANERIENLKRYYLDNLLKIKGAYHSIAVVNDSLKGVSLTQQKIIARQKNLLVFGKGTQIEEDSGRARVLIDTSLVCASIKGWTLTNPPKYSLNIKFSPLTIDAIITDFGQEIHGVLIPSPEECFIIDSVNFQVAPDIKGSFRDGFDMGEFLLGGGVGIGIMALIKAFQ